MAQYTAINGPSALLWPNKGLQTHLALKQTPLFQAVPLCERKYPSAPG